MTNIKHVFFDLDHTLWDFEKNSELTFRKILPISGVRVNPTDFLAHYVPINANYWKLYREEKVKKDDLRYLRLKDTFDAIGVKVNDKTIHFLSEEYINFLSSFNHLFDGAKEILEYLQVKYQLHIITNGFEEVQNLKMERSGIIHFFKQIITSESVGVKKPNPIVFEYALDRVGATPNESVMIGDSLEADIQGAINSKMHAIHYNSERKSIVPKNITSINHLLEIKQYL